jgi:tetratricopeptide (TPR) repeat protein
LFKKAINILLLCGIFLISCKSRKETAASLKTSMEEIEFAKDFVDGCALRMKGNFEEAKALFVRCNQIDPASAPVKYELAMVYKLLGVNDQAVHYARAAAQADPKNEWYQLLLIELYNGMRQYNQSVKILESLVKNNPGKSEFKEDLAIEYSVLGQYDKAFKIYDELEKIYGINEQLTLNKAKLLKNQKKFKEAETELIRLSQSNPKETRFYSYLADFYIEQGDLEKAKEMYDKIISIEPNNPFVNLALHDYYSTQQKTAEAYECLKKAFLNPDLDVNTKANIATTFYENINRADGAVYREHGTELSKIMVQVHPQSAEANAIYADFLKLDRKLNEAAEYYYKSATKDKANFRVWKEMLGVYSQLRQWDSLEHQSNIAMEVFPSFPEVYFYNGYANIQLANYKKAARSLQDGLEFVVDNKLMMIEFYKNMGEAYFYSGEYDKAYKAFEDVLKINSDQKEVLNQYAWYLLQRKESLDKAEKLSRKANELEPNNSNYMDTYGWILYAEKKYTEAEEWLEGAAKLSRKPIILEHYGDVLFRLGKTAEALKYWEEARSAGGNSATLIKKIKDKKIDE